MKIVLDTNVLLMSFRKGSPYRILYDGIREGKYELLVTNEILFEYEEIISIKSSAEVAETILSLFLASRNVILTQVYFKWNLITVDVDDNKFSDCALASNADYIVTNDKHFDILKKSEFPKLSVIDADEFVALLKQSI